MQKKEVQSFGLPKLLLNRTDHSGIRVEMVAPVEMVAKQNLAGNWRKIKS